MSRGQEGEIARKHVRLLHNKQGRKEVKLKRKLRIRLFGPLDHSKHLRFWI